MTRSEVDEHIEGCISCTKLIESGMSLEVIEQNLGGVVPDPPAGVKWDEKEIT